MNLLRKEMKGLTNKCNLLIMLSNTSYIRYRFTSNESFSTIPFQESSELHANNQMGQPQNPIKPNTSRIFEPMRLEKNSESFEKGGSYDEFAVDVEKVYRILRKFHSRAPKLELALKESGVVVRSGLTERVLNRCGDAGNLGYSFFVWASKQPGYRHSYDVYKSMIKILGKMRQFGAVWALIEEMRRAVSCPLKC